MKKHVLSALILLLSCVAAYAQPAGWLYETPYAVTSTSPQLITNYSFAVVVNTQALISAGKMKADGSDIRFGTPCNGTKMFNYYIDSGINTTSTLIYVTIDSLKPNNTRTIYMFYGNPSATATSSLSALSGPFTMFNGVDNSGLSIFEDNSCCTLTDTMQVGVYFQPNQPIIVTALGAFLPEFDATNVLMQLSSYNSNLGTVVANKKLSYSSFDSWTFTDLPTPIPLNTSTPYAVSVALDGQGPFGGGINFWDFTLSLPTNISPQVNVLGYVEDFAVPSPVASTAPAFPNITSAIAGFTDIKYYVGPAPNNYVTILPDTSINASAFYDPRDTLVCPGATATFTALAGGLAATYQWQINTGNGWNNLSATGVYSNVNHNALTIAGVTNSMNGYQYRVYMTSTCGTGYSNAATLSVNTTPAVTPVSYITGPDPACMYTNATYNLTTNVPSGSYVWYKNGVSTGATGTQYSFLPAQGDVIYAVITAPTNAALGCYTPDESVTNQYTISIGNNFTPHDSIAASSNNGCAGSVVDYTTYTNVIGGTYQWLVNGNVVAGATASTYTYAPNNGDLITEVITTPSNGCYNVTGVTSQPVAATTTYGVTPTIVVTGPATAAENQQITVTANILNYGTDYKMLWYNDWVLIDSTHDTNTLTITKKPKPTNDYISARIYPTSPANGTCYSEATSNLLTIGFTPYNEGVNNVANNNGVSAYPNPFSSKVSVTGLKEGDRIVVYDMAGRAVSMEYQASGATEDYVLQNLSSGHYILRVTDSDGKVKANLPLSKL